MRLLEMLRRERGTERRIDEFKKTALTIDLKETGEVRPYTLDANEEWRLTAKVEIRFWANGAQFEDAARNAEHVLIAELYSDLWKEMPELKMAIYNGDKRAALAVCERIDTWLKR